MRSTTAPFPEFLFHHEKGRVSDENLRFQSPQLALPEGLTLGRMMDRVALRDEIERQSRELSAAADDGQFDRYREAAVSLLANTKVHDAFDLEKAGARLLDRYGRNSFGWSLVPATKPVPIQSMIPRSRKISPPPSMKRWACRGRSCGTTSPADRIFSTTPTLSKGWPDRRAAARPLSGKGRSPARRQPLPSAPERRTTGQDQSRIPLLRRSGRLSQSHNL